MSRGQHLSLEEARKLKALEQFAKEHPSEGDKAKFEELMGAMAKGEHAVKNRKAKRGT